MSVTSRDRLNALLRRQNPDCVALKEEEIWKETYANWVRQGRYPTRRVHKEAGQNWRNPSDGVIRAVEVAGEYDEPVPPWQHFGADMGDGGGAFDAKPLKGHNELVEETEEWDIRRDGAGASFKYWKHRTGTPEHVDFQMTTREVWETVYKPHLMAFDPSRIGIADTRAKLAETRAGQVWSSFGPLFVWELARGSLGDLALYTSLLTDPGWIHDFNRTYTDFYKRYYGYIFDNIGLPDGMWLYEDMGYKNGLFASPRTFERLIFPYYAEIIAFFHSYDLPVILHSCGSVGQILPLVVDVGFDALNPMERKAKGNDPFMFAEQYGDKLAFVGGLDARVLETNDKDHVRREVAAYVDGMKARGARLVFGTDHSISPMVEYDTYCVALETYRRHMRY